MTAKGYIVFAETIHDQSTYDEYIAGVMPTIEAAGGRLLSVEDEATVLEGELPGERIVILEFDSVDAARAWFDSPGYQAIVGKRHASAESTAYIVSGFVPA